jgi:hypothetical protein
VLPADKYGYTPTPEVASFGDTLVHIAGITQRFIDTANAPRRKPPITAPWRNPREPPSPP